MNWKIAITIVLGDRVPPFPQRAGARAGDLEAARPLFRTEAAFAQGSSLLLEAGVRNMTWFFANDESIKTADNLNLRLDRIVVRSCPS